MNIYYHRVIHIDILDFWKEIGKMSLVPFRDWFFVIFICFVFMKFIQYRYLLFVFLRFSCIYVPLFWFFGMNAYEKELFCFSGSKVCGATAEEFAINMYRILEFLLLVYRIKLFEKYCQIVKFIIMKYCLKRMIIYDNTFME